MPYLKQIVSYLNQQIAGVLNASSFSGSKYYGIAVTVPRNESETEINYFPCIVNDYDDEKTVSVDNSFPFILYHKNNGITTDLDPNVKFGNNIMLEIANFQMIVFGDRRVLHVTPEDLYAGIVSAIPSAIPKAIIEPLVLRMVSITQLIPNFNSINVYSQEYKVSQYPLKPSDIYFSINYRIESRYDKTCFDINQCIESQ